MIAPLLSVVAKHVPSLVRAMADGGYQGTATATAVQSQAGIPLEIVKRTDTAKGFKVVPKRWIVERTFGWLGRCRRLAKDFENVVASRATFIVLAMIRLLTRRIARAGNRMIRPDGLLAQSDCSEIRIEVAFSDSTAVDSGAARTGRCPKL